MEYIFFILIFLLIIFLLISKINEKIQFSNYYDEIKTKYDSLDDFNKKELLNNLVNINKHNFTQYKIYNDNLKKKYNFDIGYSKVDNINNKSIGFCPLNYYFKGKFDNDKKKIFSNCKKCFKCNSKPGYFLEKGCLGDKDSVCKFGKVPFEIYSESHKYPFYNHDILPQHSHKYNFNKKSEYSCPGLSPSITPGPSGEPIFIKKENNCFESNGFSFKKSKLNHKHIKI